jgi:hypothetical protein
MRRLSYVLLLLLVTGGIVRALYGGNRVLIDAPTTIHAGDSWLMSLVIARAEAGTRVQVSLVNGLQVLEETLILGTGGTARWQIGAGQITHAGNTLVLIHYDGEEHQHLLHVLPLAPSDADLFSTANTLPAYGEGRATIMLLIRDKWGNAPHDRLRFPLAVRFPQTVQRSYTFDYANGIAWRTLVSRGEPGRIRLTLDHDALAAALELMQAPGTPESIALSVSPNCVLDDGRDMIDLTASVADSHDHAVVDGTLVIFTWDGGFGYGRTIDGQAVLSLPAQQRTGWHMFWAAAGTVKSTAAYLRVSQEDCTDE